MNRTNLAIKQQIEENREVFTAFRRSTIAHQVKAHMLEKGIRNIDLAQRLSVSEANVSRWLRGDQNLSLDTLYALADALGEQLVLDLRDVSGQQDLFALSESTQEWDSPAANDAACMNTSWLFKLRGAIA